MKSTAKHNAHGEIGGIKRVYGGDTGLIHVKDGHRVATGRALASNLENMIREAALSDGRNTSEEVNDLSLCPGCYMTVYLNAMVETAKRNGQSLTELSKTMALALEDAVLAEKLDQSPYAEHVQVQRPMDWHEAAMYYLGMELGT